MKIWSVEAMHASMWPKNMVECGIDKKTYFSDPVQLSLGPHEAYVRVIFNTTF
jgi:hypothetical protein